MKAYNVEKLRNVCLMSHGGAGKTTLAEAMLFNTGVLDRFGKVNDGNTTMDYDPEEIKRKLTLSTAVAPCEWKDCKINIIDTPGYFDFVGEIKQGSRVADSTVILIPAKGGVEVGAEKSWAYAKERSIPKMFFVSKMDEEHADFFEVLEQMKSVFGKSVIPFQLPIIEGEKFTGFVDILSMTAKKFDGDKLKDAEIPADLADKTAKIKETLNEAVAESSEELMEKYFGGEEFTAEDVKNGLQSEIANGSVAPVFCGSALLNRGVKALMDMIVEYMPSPTASAPIKALKAGTDSVVELDVSDDESMSALVFKTIADPFVGKISIFRVYSGTIRSDSVVYNSATGKTEKVAQLFMLRGKKQIPTDKITAGDIGAVAKLLNTNTNDTLCDQGNPVVLDKIIYPEPALSLAVEAKAKGDEEKINSGLTRLMDEDPTFNVVINSETKQTVISGVGEQHLDVVISKLNSKFGVAVNLVEPKVPYRETIRKKVKVEGKHVKQSGGHGQYGIVWIEFEHGDTEDLIFEEKIFGGVVPKGYHPAVEKGLREAIQSGVLAGYPVVNLKATLVDGKYHDVDSSEMSFKLAAQLAYRKGLPQADPVLLEPISRVEVYIPESYMGDIIGDLNKRRGRILGMNPRDDGLQEVVADVPTAEMAKYTNDLRSMTQGRGAFKQTFDRYEEAPAMIAQKVIEEARRSMTDDGSVE